MYYTEYTLCNHIRFIFADQHYIDKIFVNIECVRKKRQFHLIISIISYKYALEKKHEPMDKRWRRLKKKTNMTNVEMGSKQFIRSCTNTRWHYVKLKIIAYSVNKRIFSAFTRSSLPFVTITNTVRVLINHIGLLYSSLFSWKVWAIDSAQGQTLSTYLLNIWLCCIACLMLI